MKLPLACVAFCLAGSVTAEAQTANGSPTDPAPRGLPGVLRGVTRTPPTVGGARPRTQAQAHSAGRPKGSLPKIVTESDKQFQLEQKQIERQMTICKGC